MAVVLEVEGYPPREAKSYGLGLILDEGDKSKVILPGSDIPHGALGAGAYKLTPDNKLVTYDEKGKPIKRTELPKGTQIVVERKGGGPKFGFLVH